MNEKEKQHEHEIKECIKTINKLSEEKRELKKYKDCWESLKDHNFLSALIEAERGDIPEAKYFATLHNLMKQVEKAKKIVLLDEAKKSRRIFEALG